MWIPLGKSMKVATRKPGVVTYRGRIYVVGGMGKEKDLNFVQIFNPVTEEWEDNDIGVIKPGKNKNVESNASDTSVPPLEELCGKKKHKFMLMFKICCNFLAYIIVQCSTCNSILIFIYNEFRIP